MGDPFDLRPGEAEGLGIVLAAYDLSQRLGGLDSTDTSARLAQIFAWPGIARVLGLKAWTDAAFEPFVAAITAAAIGRDAAGPRFVLGACAEARDDVVAAERLYRSALDADLDHPLALVEVARHETDRGDYAAALRHLRVARVPADDSERAWFEGLVQPAVPKVGRNEPCPCGYDEWGTLKCETCSQCAQACPIECIDMGGMDTRGRFHVHWGPPET